MNPNHDPRLQQAKMARDAAKMRQEQSGVFSAAAQAPKLAESRATGGLRITPAPRSAQPSTVPQIQPPAQMRPQVQPAQPPPPAPPQGQYTTGPQSAGSTGTAPTSIAAGMGVANNAGVADAAGGRYAAQPQRTPPPLSTSMATGSSVEPAQIWDGDAQGNGSYRQPDYGGRGFGYGSDGTGATGRGDAFGPSTSMDPGAPIEPFEEWNGDAQGNGEYVAGDFGGGEGFGDGGTGAASAGGAVTSDGRSVDDVIAMLLGTDALDTTDEEALIRELMEGSTGQSIVDQRARFGAAGLGGAAALGALEGDIARGNAQSAAQQTFDVQRGARDEQLERLQSGLGAAATDRGLDIEEENRELILAALNDSAADDGVGDDDGDYDGPGNGIGGGDDIVTVGAQYGGQAVNAWYDTLYGGTPDGELRHFATIGELPPDATYAYTNGGMKIYTNENGDEAYSVPAGGR